MVVLPSAKRARLRLDDVAAEVGVSTATVSLVLRGIAGPSGATRERVLEAASRLGYRPDRAASVLASRRSRLIGIQMDVSNLFHARLVEDVHEAADRHGYQLVLSTVTRTQSETRAIETLLDSRCEALVLLGPQAPAERLSELSRQLPVVVVGRPLPPAANVDVVRTADDLGLEQSVAHLAGLGHRRIAYVDGDRGTVATFRRRSYRAAMRRHGLADHIQVLPGGETELAGARVAQVLLQAGQLPTAVQAFNDRCAVGLIDALVRARVDVPGTVSVVGFDDSPVARLPHVELTTISQDARQLTEDAITVLIQRLDDARTDPVDVVVPPHLVVRGTTAPPG